MRSTSADLAGRWLNSSLPPAHCSIRDHEFAFGGESRPHVTSKELATLATGSNSRYLPHGAFYGELRRQVGLHFTITGRVPNEAPGMHLKTAVMLGWFAGSYTLLSFWATTWWQASALAISVGMAMAGIGFNIQHDGGHGSYSRRESVNLIMAFALDLLGASSYVWSWKHNVFHHSNPNIAGLDSDIDLQPFCRLAPTQPRRAWHRFQHLYIWFLYSFLVVKWQLVDDFKELASGRIGGQHFARPRGRRLWILVAGKVIFFSWAFVLPLLLHPILSVAF